MNLSEMEMGLRRNRISERRFTNMDLRIVIYENFIIALPALELVTARCQYRSTFELNYICSRNDSQKGISSCDPDISRVMVTVGILIRMG